MSGFEDIEIFDEPIKVELGQWMVKHIDVDSIIDKMDSSRNIVVYAVSKTKKGRGILRKYREEYFPNKRILGGISESALNGVF